MNQFTHSEAARAVFDWLYLRDQIDVGAQFSAIMGFGSFDLGIPDKCAELYEQGFSQKVIFSGNRSASSGMPENPEALFFKERFLERVPHFNQENMILETQSDNLMENVRFTFKDEGFRNRIYSLLIVANPHRQRRTYLTCKKYIPTIRVVNAPPITDIEQEVKKYRALGTNFYDVMLNEIMIIELNSAANFFPAEIPQDIRDCYEVLKNQNLSVT
jgi:hypothetical protein